jgi:hypothetical protein
MGAGYSWNYGESLRQKIKLPATRCNEIMESLREDASTFVESAKPVTAMMRPSVWEKRLRDKPKFL